MSEPPNCYHVLGLSPPVTAEQVRSSYVRLIKQHHPDRARPGPPSLRLQEIQRAYQTLRDDRRRADHDQTLIEREQAHRADMRRARRRISRLEHPRPRPRRGQKIAWPRPLIAMSAGGLLLLIMRLMLTS
jgi:curved DNA-binding protein CbpA